MSLFWNPEKLWNSFLRLMIISRVRGERCERCHAKKGRNGLRSCSNGCENVLYCSIECQESDYITHVASGECGLIQKRLPSNDNVRFILRFLLALRVIPGKDLPCIIDRVPGYSEPRSFRWLHRVNEDTQFWRFREMTRKNVASVTARHHLIISIKASNGLNAWIGTHIMYLTSWDLSHWPKKMNYEWKLKFIFFFRE